MAQAYLGQLSQAAAGKHYFGLIYDFTRVVFTNHLLDREGSVYHPTDQLTGIAILPLAVRVPDRNSVLQAVIAEAEELVELILVGPKPVTLDFELWPLALRYLGCRTKSLQCPISAQLYLDQCQIDQLHCPDTGYLELTPGTTVMELHSSPRLHSLELTDSARLKILHSQPRLQDIYAVGLLEVIHDQPVLLRLYLAKGYRVGHTPKLRELKLTQTGLRYYPQATDLIEITSQDRALNLLLDQVDGHYSKLRDRWPQLFYQE